MIECKFCKKKFCNKSSLKKHQKTAKYCLKIQGKGNIESKYKCEACNKSFTRKDLFIYHKNICISYKNKLTKDTMEEKIKNVTEAKNQIIEIQEKYLEQIRQDYKELVNRYVQNNEDKIKLLNKKYLKKQPRQQYIDKNVIYILTTPGLKKERRYIFGKATNLTSRLSTYNKSDEHEVVFHLSCGDKEKMSLVESLTFNKLQKYREQANRERFILPENQDISLFSGTIKNCLEFLTKGETEMP